ncbi:MAG: LamG domain-containing protein, partial [Puniceicoccales bacterium]|nr:LamG domain-containing protein [Puniceicoccales bacterium]
MCAFAAFAPSGVGAQSGSDLAKDPALVARWTFDSARWPLGGGSGAASPSPAAATLPKNVPGVFGKAFDFSPADKSMLEVAPGILPKGIRQLTFSAWVAPRRNSGNLPILYKGDVGRHGDNRITFGIKGGKFISFGINCGGNYAELDAFAPPALFDGTPHHVVVSFDGKTMRAYFDGVEIGSFERQVPLSTVHDFAPLRISRDAVANSNYSSLEKAANHGAPFFIGFAPGRNNEFFDGILDDLRFYSRALTEAEIQALLAEAGDSTAGKAGPVPASLGIFSAPETLEALLGAADKVSPNDTNRRYEFHLALNKRFPADVNAYTMKWKKSPAELLFLDQASRRALAQNLVTPSKGGNPAPAFEYLPITDFQWAALSKTEHAKWRNAKALKEKLENPSAVISAADLYRLQDLVHDRPATRERVAAYVEPRTPETRDRTAEEARAVVEADWLFQANGKPTVGLALQEIAYTRAL